MATIRIADATREQLAEACKINNLSTRANATREALAAALVAAFPDMTEIEAPEPVAAAPEAAERPKQTAWVRRNDVDFSGEPRYRVIVAKSDRPDAVKVIRPEINGYGISIVRGEPTVIPESFYLSMKQAVLPQYHMDPESGLSRAGEMPRYTIQVLEILPPKVAA